MSLGKEEIFEAVCNANEAMSETCPSDVYEDGQAQFMAFSVVPVAYDTGVSLFGEIVWTEDNDDRAVIGEDEGEEILVPLDQHLLKLFCRKAAIMSATALGLLK